MQLKQAGRGTWVPVLHLCFWEKEEGKGKEKEEDEEEEAEEVESTQLANALRAYGRTVSTPQSWSGTEVKHL